jgi:intracellular multiplication protein IcmE
MAEQQSVGTIEPDENGNSSGARKPIFKTALSDSRSRMMVVLMLVMAVAALVIAWAFYSIFMQNPKATSAVGDAPSGVESTAGGDEDEEITKLLVEQDNRRADTAQQTGRSMVATLTQLSQPSSANIPPPRTSKPEQQTAPPADAPKKTQRRSERTQQSTQRTQRAEQPREIDQNIGSRIEAIMAASGLNAPSTQVFEKKQASAQGGGLEGQLTKTSANDRERIENAPDGERIDSPANGGRVIIPATALRYAVMENAANSDIKGPVVARIVQGKYRGGRLLGSFDRTETYLRIEFDSLTAPEIGTVKVKAIAVNPDNSSIGLATAVNHHFLERYGGLIIGGFIGGYGKAVAQSGSTTTTSPFGSSTTQRGNYSSSDELAIAAGEAGQVVGDRLAKTTQRPITVKVARGTPIGVRFLDDVRLDTRNNRR